MICRWQNMAAFQKIRIIPHIRLDAILLAASHPGSQLCTILVYSPGQICDTSHRNASSWDSAPSLPMQWMPSLSVFSCPPRARSILPRRIGEAHESHAAYREAQPLLPAQE